MYLFNDRLYSVSVCFFSEWSGSACCLIFFRFLFLFFLHIEYSTHFCFDPFLLLLYTLGLCVLFLFFSVWVLLAVRSTVFGFKPFRPRYRDNITWQEKSVVLCGVGALAIRGGGNITRACHAASCADEVRVPILCDPLPRTCATIHYYTIIIALSGKQHIVWMTGAP